MIAQHERKASQKRNMEVLQTMEDSYNFYGVEVPTYLSLMQKYPEARDDILLLRTSKNQALIGITIIFSIGGFLVGYFINQVI